MNGTYSLSTPRMPKMISERFILSSPMICRHQRRRGPGKPVSAKEIRSLDFMPSRHAVVDWEPWKSMGMHRMPVDHFVVYYAVNDSSRAVTVIRIFYGGRDVEGIIQAERE